MTANIDIILDDQRWDEALADATAVALACHAAAAALEPRVDRPATLLLADDATLQDLNARFAGKDKPTNVLSFVAGDPASLGDIAIAFETTHREAEALGIAFRDHVRHLIVHGLLHLAGHDHAADDEAERMEKLETRILMALGVADPYEEAGAAGFSDPEGGAGAQD